MGGGDVGVEGITLMKNKFQKASITPAQARAPAFAFQCEVQPPLFMTLYTSKPRPASLYLARPHSISSLIPIVTSSQPRVSWQHAARVWMEDGWRQEVRR